MSLLCLISPSLGVLGRVPTAWKSYGKWFLFSRPRIVMEFVKKSDKSHGKVIDFLNTDFDYQNA